MRTAAVATLKAGLSEYLAMVKKGEEIIVTDRGTPVAKISPLKRDASVVSRNLARLEKSGLARVGGGVADDFLKIKRPVDKKGNALKSLLSERESGK